MVPLRAPWLGSWTAPWGPGRGRRWGDATWALAALSQAWLLGGRDGHWPQADWYGTPAMGPRPGPREGDTTPLPDPHWVALLRHGSAKLVADSRGNREGELEAWCWAQLLEGNADPWWARASLLLDLEERRRWIPWLGAVDSLGELHLPPFLELLIPQELRRLPPGWWERLLSGLDDTGCLLPVGVLPQGPPWELLLSGEGAWLRPLLLKALPPPLGGFRGEPWLAHLGDGFWMIDPSLRAWGRGEGLPRPARSLALGSAPGPAVAAILAGQVPDHPWAEAIRCDLEARPRCEAPQPCGEPSLDRLRMRWGGEPAAQALGYPPWGASAHPCADPFHWMAEGRRAFLAQDMEGSLRAFTLAHAHFLRLDSTLWAGRAAANAGYAALFWGDLQGLAFWQKAAGPQTSPYLEYDRALLKACLGEWRAALPALRGLTRTHPDFEPAWVLWAHHGLVVNEPEEVREALPHLSPCSFHTLLKAYLAGDFTAALPDLEPEERLQWAFLRLRHGAGSFLAYWTAWAECSNHLMRLETGLLVLEAFPPERTAEHLLLLQAIGDRTRSGTHLDRLRRLWPSAAAEAPRTPMEHLGAWLAHQPDPTWLFWAGPGGPSRMGSGSAPPEALVGQLLREGFVQPCRAGHLIWWSLPLRWEGTQVGAALVGLQPEAAPERGLAVGIAAPWVAQLLPSPVPTELPMGGALLADGSEPMASVLREMARVAPSELAVLILGPTGSGKELAARELHRLSGRSGPLVPINCAAFAESLLESELFGHVKGAFTGADRDRRGAIEMAQGGTLFLDEIADLSPRLQSLFLRVLQEREVRRVGGDRAQRVDVRFVAATHQDLEAHALRGCFRRDLLYRLQGTVLHLPSLAARRHEFPFLVPRLVARLAQEMGRGAPPLTAALPQVLARHPWPGNFRELCHALERALLRCGEGPLKVDHFPELRPADAPRRHRWVESTQDFQRQLLQEILHQYRFQVTEAAEALGLTRPALYSAARRVGLDLVAERDLWQRSEPPV